MPFIILAISAIVHFYKFGYPASVVFDEVHAGNFLINYWHGTYFFDVHPPLGKLIEMLFGYITGADHVFFDPSTIGNTLPISMILLRLIPMIAGTLLPLIIYWTLKRLDFSKSASFVGAMFIVFENSLVVQSRFILYDVIMILFGFIAILCYLEYLHNEKRSQKIILFTISIIFAAAVPSIKWTGLAFPLIIILMETYRLYSENIKIKELAKKISVFSLKYLSTAIIIYLLLFAIHFSLLPKTGPGDAFMTNRFQSSLIGNPYFGNPAFKSEDFFAKTTELNIAMLKADKSLTNPHQYSSKWYTWPLEVRSIFYWESKEATSTAGTAINNIATSTATTLQNIVDNTKQTRSYIYLLGNPIIYWLGCISMIALIMYGASLLKRKNSIAVSAHRKRALFFIVIGYLVNFLPFIFIGRIMFLYHYLAALVFATMAIVYVIDDFTPKQKKWAFIILLLTAFSAFIYFAPLTYGTPLTDSQLAARMWFGNWR